MPNPPTLLTRRAICAAPLLGAGLAAARLAHAGDHGFETVFHFPAGEAPDVKPLISVDGSQRWMNIATVQRAWRIPLSGALGGVHSFAVQKFSYYSHFIIASDGLAYANTGNSGEHHAGTVSRWQTPKGHPIDELYRFDDAGQNGLQPTGGLIEGFDGALYGTTRNGGAHQAGTVFRITLAGELTTLYHFNVFQDGHEGGYAPAKGLTKGLDGNYYGVTELGGDFDSGTVYRLTPEGVLTILHLFGDNATGRLPRGGLTLAPDGLFYGLATNGGEQFCGCIYSISHAGEYKVLHSFQPHEGSSPIDYLYAAPDGVLYGTCAGGGTFGQGTAFRFRPSQPDKLDVLHHFAGNATDGGNPMAGFEPAPNGYLYSSTRSGGLNGGGTLFRIRP